jgi:ABC-type transport system involved in cytochrome bd biosynthesis fused ATPase/permease subunit
MAFQGIFLMSAFTASMKLKPVLNPKHEDMVPFTLVHGGVTISAKYANALFYDSRKLTLRRGLSYTYPGSSEPALKNVNFSLKAGETLAIVGYNGSGVSFQDTELLFCTYNTIAREIHTRKDLTPHR